MYVGQAGVTSSTGLPLAAGNTPVVYDAAARSPISGICATGHTARVQVKFATVAIV